MSKYLGDAQPVVAALDADSVVLQAAQEQRLLPVTPKNVSLLNVSTSINSFGETVLQWRISDSGTAPETFIVCCDFGGYFAPLGSIPAVPGVRKYRFIDHIMNAYVGKKTYSIVIIFTDGTAKTFSSVATSTKNSSIPRELYE
jgi:hypothetical protein